MNQLIEKTSIRVFAPATVANVGCGFDIFGFALDQPGDEVELSVVDKPGVVITGISGDRGRLPLEAEKNTAGKSLQSMLEYINADFGIEMELHKKMPIGSGLGSSAASSVASVFALNQMLKTALSVEELLPFAIEGEKIASGANVHLDNIAACLYGGFILVRSRDPIDIVTIPTPKELICTVVYPKIEIKTADARLLLKKQIDLSKAVTQWGNVAGLISALFKKDYGLLSRSLQDVVAEPVRSILIPFFSELQKTATELGCLGCNISGSGPSVVALSNKSAVAKATGKAFQDLLTGKGVESNLYISKINNTGPKLI